MSSTERSISEAHTATLSWGVKRLVCEVNHLLAAEFNKEWIFTSLQPQI